MAIDSNQINDDLDAFQWSLELDDALLCQPFVPGLLSSLTSGTHSTDSIPSYLVKSYLPPSVKRKGSVEGGVEGQYLGVLLLHLESQKTYYGSTQLKRLYQSLTISTSSDPIKNALSKVDSIPKDAWHDLFQLLMHHPVPSSSVSGRYGALHVTPYGSSSIESPNTTASSSRHQTQTLSSEPTLHLTRSIPFSLLPLSIQQAILDPSLITAIHLQVTLTLEFYALFPSTTSTDVFWRHFIQPLLGATRGLAAALECSLTRTAIGETKNDRDVRIGAAKGAIDRNVTGTMDAIPTPSEIEVDVWNTVARTSGLLDVRNEQLNDARVDSVPIPRKSLPLALSRRSEAAVSPRAEAKSPPTAAVMVKHECSADDHPAATTDADKTLLFNSDRSGTETETESDSSPLHRTSSSIPNPRILARETQPHRSSLSETHPRSDSLQVPPFQEAQPPGTGPTRHDPLASSSLLRAESDSSALLRTPSKDVWTDLKMPRRTSPSAGSATDVSPIVRTSTKKRTATIATATSSSRSSSRSDSAQVARDSAERDRQREKRRQAVLEAHLSTRGKKGKERLAEPRMNELGAARLLGRKKQTKSSRDSSPETSPPSSPSVDIAAAARTAENPPAKKFKRSLKRFDAPF